MVAGDAGGNQTRQFELHDGISGRGQQAKASKFISHRQSFNVTYRGTASTVGTAPRFTQLKRKDGFIGAGNQSKHLNDSSRHALRRRGARPVTGRPPPITGRAAIGTVRLTRCSEDHGVHPAASASARYTNGESSPYDTTPCFTQKGDADNLPSPDRRITLAVNHAQPMLVSEVVPLSCLEIRCVFHLATIGSAPGRRVAASAKREGPAQCLGLRPPATSPSPSF